MPKSPQTLKAGSAHLHTPAQCCGESLHDDAVWRGVQMAISRVIPVCDDVKALVTAHSTRNDCMAIELVDESPEHRRPS